MCEKTSDRLEASHRQMLAWCEANGGEPDGYAESALAEIAFWRTVEEHTSPEFAAVMFAQWQDTRLTTDEAP